MAEYDLTSKIAPHLDRHLVFPLLEFLQEKQLYPDEQILKSKIELLSKTNMVDYAMDIHKSLYRTEEVPQEMTDRRVEVVARLKSLEEMAAPLVSFLQNPSLVSELRSDKQYNLQMLNDRYQVILNDPFLGKQVQEGNFITVPLRDEFLENARLFIFETYCRIHQCIDIRMLAEKLNMNNVEAERWIVNLVRNAKLDAKIDSKSGTVVMGVNCSSILDACIKYEQIIENTKQLSMRTYMLASNVAAAAPTTQASSGR